MKRNGKRGTLPPLLMRCDPLDNNTGFLGYMDGYLFFGDDATDFGGITRKEDYS